MDQSIPNYRRFAPLVLFGLVGIWLATNGTSVNIPKDYPEVTLTEASALISAGAVVVDVRGPESFKEGHIPGAIPIPLEILRQDIPASLIDAKAKSVVVYCGHGQGRGPEGTRLLAKAGFARAANLRSGLEGWKTAGLPLEKG
jgi:rhodanese-related sulfurtransferase